MISKNWGYQMFHMSFFMAAFESNKCLSVSNLIEVNIFYNYNSLIRIKKNLLRKSV